MSRGYGWHSGCCGNSCLRCGKRRQFDWPCCRRNRPVSELAVAGAQEYNHGHTSLKDFALPLLAAVIELLVHRGSLNFVVAGANQQNSNEIGFAKDLCYFREDLVEAGFLLVSCGLEEVSDMERQPHFGLGSPRQKLVSDRVVAVSPKPYGVAIVELAVQAGIEELLNGFGNALGTALHGAGRFDDQQTAVSAGRAGLSEERAGEQEQNGDKRAPRCGGSENSDQGSTTRTQCFGAER